MSVLGKVITSRATYTHGDIRIIKESQERLAAIVFSPMEKQFDQPLAIPVDKQRLLSLKTVVDMLVDDWMKQDATAPEAPQ